MLESLENAIDCKHTKVYSKARYGWRDANCPDAQKAVSDNVITMFTTLWKMS